VLRDDARPDEPALAHGWTLIAADLVHPFEAVPVPGVAAFVASARTDTTVHDPEILAVVERICGVVGLSMPTVLTFDGPGHASAAGVIRIGGAALADGAPSDREALLAHCCGHLLLPHAGELSADRVAALYQGSADAITRAIFAAAVHSGVTDPDPAVRVREIQAWCATSGFARLVTSVATAVRP
jgi:hypothetical protein